MKSIIFYVMILTSMASLISCGEDKPKSAEEVMPVSSSIKGNWLLASSNASEWTTFDFQSSGSVSAEWLNNGKIQTALGSYFSNDEMASVTGSYAVSANDYKYIDWIVKSIQPYQLDIEVYSKDGNDLIMTTSIYKILTNLEVENGKDLSPDYRGITGSNKYSDFTSLNSDIAKVDSNTGVIESISEGKTFITYKTEGGTAAICVNVRKDALPSLSENILGTWVTDVKGYIWERDVFGPDGYFYANWSREGIYPTSNESAQGTYTINEKDMIIIATGETPSGQRLNPEYRIQSIDRFSFYTFIYSGGDKVGEFEYQRMIDSITMKIGSETQPDYESLIGGYRVNGFSSHDNPIATVDDNGKITAIAIGMTYIDVETNQGTAVVEVNVE